MQAFSEWLDQVFGTSTVPPGTILVVAAILAVALLFRKLFSTFVIGQVQKLTRRTRSNFDDVLLEALKEPVGWAIVVGGFWFAYLLLARYLDPPVADFLRTILNLGFVIIVGWMLFRSAELLSRSFGRLTRLTETELDDMLAPYIPLFIKIIALLLIMLKMGEALLGLSAAALIGLLGGAGITIGLVFRDVLSDWFATIIIYTDRLYRAGDLIELRDGSWAYVDKIGLRSTAIRDHASGIVQKIPNSRMVRGDVGNRSQSPKWGIRFELKLDVLSPRQSQHIAEEVRTILQNNPKIDHTEQRALLRRLDGNARVISGRMWMDRADYYAVIEQTNLEILTLIEAEQIDPMSYTYTVVGNLARLMAN